MKPVRSCKRLWGAVHVGQHSSKLSTQCVTPVRPRAARAHKHELHHQAVIPVDHRGINSL
jgi:hypothetical protein